MPFQTGTATSFVNLLDTLRLFATANGWTENRWATPELCLQKGTVFANMFADATTLRLKGSLGYDPGAAWSAQTSTHTPTPWMRDGQFGAITWPATYWLFAHASPDDIMCVLRYQPTRFMYITFGQLLKYGTYIGGEYYSASFETTFQIDPGNMSAQISSIANAPGLFWRRVQSGINQQLSQPDNIHAEIDSKVWGGAVAGVATPNSPPPTIQFIASASDHSFPLQNRGVSAFNGLMTLLPIEVFALRPDSHYSPLGRIEHVRYCNLINHNAADIIDIGGQRWMLFPMVEKGCGLDVAGIHYGHAVKYDGP
jgi:hypothetical protein